MRILLVILILTLSFGAKAEVILLQVGQTEAKLENKHNFGVEIHHAYWKDDKYHIAVDANVLSIETLVQKVKFEGNKLDLRFDVYTINGDYAYATAIVKRFTYVISGLESRDFKLRFNGYRQGSYPRYDDDEAYLKKLKQPRKRSGSSSFGSFVLPPPTPTTVVHDFPEQQPLFRGTKTEAESTKAMFEFIKNNIRYPAIAKEMNMEGKVYLQFVVNTEGKVESIKSLRSPHNLLEKEAIRVLKLFPPYTPGQIKGKPVKVRQTMPFTFRLER